MTLALMETLKTRACKKRRKTRSASIQFVFNRMVGKMPEEELEEEGMIEGEGEEEEDFDYEEGDYDEEWN